MSDHDQEHDGVADIHASFKDYLTGFVLAVILTVIPFWLVSHGGTGSSASTAALILAFAAAQIVVHMVYFLHMNTHSQGGWNMLSFVFTVLLVVITLSGSIWVMYHLNHNMMPGMMPTP